MFSLHVSSSIDSPISYEDFFLRHLLHNKPCLLGEWVTADWRARQDWVSADNTPNVQHLRQQFGECIVFLKIYFFKI